MKVCKLCKQQLALSSFNKNKQTKDGYTTKCKSCISVTKKKDYKDKWFVYQNRLKRNQSKKAGIEYNLTAEYLESIFPDVCPIYGTEWVMFDKSDDRSPALDRIDPSKGYIRGNVAYISARANRIKYDATPEELEKIAEWVRMFKEVQ